MRLGGRDPFGLAVAAAILDNDSHAVLAIVIGEVAQNPNAGMIHLHDGRNALRRAQPKNGNHDRIRHRVAIEPDHPE